MKYIVAFLALILIAGGIVFAKPKGSTEPINNPQQPKLDMALINSNIAQGSVLVDVRTPEEYQAGHIKGAVNNPLGDIQSGKMPSVDKEKTVYVYCRSGSRSAVAKSLLDSAGYKKVVDLGPMSGVVELGGTVVQ